MGVVKRVKQIKFSVHFALKGTRRHKHPFVQGDSVARGPKLLSIKNYAIVIIT
jgi:hypothetical protein